MELHYLDIDIDKQIPTINKGGNVSNNKKLLKKFMHVIAKKMQQQLKYKKQLTPKNFYASLTPHQQQLLAKIIFEENEKSQHKLIGGAFGFSDIWNFIKSIPQKITTILKGPRRQAPPAFRKFMEENGNLQIISIKACKEPVQSAVQDLLSVLSLGKWDQEKERFNYDSMFHVYFRMMMSNNREVILEKNAVLNIGWFDEDPRSNPNQPCDVYDEERCKTIIKQRACIDIPKPSPPIPLIDFFNRAVDMYGVSMYLYDGAYANCQKFLNWLLTANNLLTPEFQSFIMQNTEEMVANMPTITQGIMKSATDLAGIWDYLLHGEGFKKKRKTKTKKGGCLSCQQGGPKE